MTINCARCGVRFNTEMHGKQPLYVLCTKEENNCFAEAGGTAGDPDSVRPWRTVWQYNFGEITPEQKADIASSLGGSLLFMNLAQDCDMGALLHRVVIIAHSYLDPTDVVEGIIEKLPRQECMAVIATLVKRYDMAHYVENLMRENEKKGQ